MKRGFKLKDGSIWTVIAYETVDGCDNKLDWEVKTSEIINVTGVKWEEGFGQTHPYRANFSDCFFEHFDMNDERIVEFSMDVFDLKDYD